MLLVTSCDSTRLFASVKGSLHLITLSVHLLVKGSSPPFIRRARSRDGKCLALANRHEFCHYCRPCRQRCVGGKLADALPPPIEESAEERASPTFHSSSPLFLSYHGFQGSNDLEFLWVLKHALVKTALTCGLKPIQPQHTVKSEDEARSLILA